MPASPKLTNPRLDGHSRNQTNRNMNLPKGIRDKEISFDGCESRAALFGCLGKPGSGKSALMKFIADHANTMTALSIWASPLPITVASHYFWSMGTQMQRSQQGLWQSLLRQVLESQPVEAFRVACPDRWHGKVASTAPWSLSELQRSLKTVVEHQQFDKRCCFFINGLDEFDGDHLDLIQALAQLSGFPAVKMCLASRPENAFENTLGKSAVSKIYLHPITREDILEFTTSRLTQHPLWASTVSEAGGNAMIRTITQRAQGVFLWVFLVTKLLREGLTNYDKPADLQQVLDSLPDNLERLSKQALESVNPRYHEKMANFLEITLEAHEPSISIYTTFMSTSMTTQTLLSKDEIYGPPREGPNKKSKANARV